MNLWNQRELPPPPTITFKAINTDLDLNKFKNALQDGINHLKNNKILSNELAILSRILYRMKMKFRSAKDFKLLEKLRRCLDLFYKANLAGYLKNLLQMVPSEYYKSTYLPSKYMLQYILVRLQGLAKLMERTYDTCIIVASELNSRLYIGHFWKLFLILFALVSRITVLIKFNTKFLCELYGKLLPHCNKLQAVGSNWLPEDYILPTDLRLWLGVPWVYEEEFVDLTFESNNSIIDFFNLVGDDEDDNDVLFCDEYILLDDEDRNIIKDFNKLPPLKNIHHNRMRGFSINEDDIGEDIEEVAISAKQSNTLETVDEDVESELKQSNLLVELDDSGEEINGPLEDISVISVPESPRTSVITIDDTITHQKSTGKKKKKKKNMGTDNNLTKPTKRKLSFSGEDLAKKKLKKIQQILGKKNKKKQTTKNLIFDNSVICLEDDSFPVQSNSKQPSTTTLMKERHTSDTSQPVFLSLDLTSEKANARQLKQKKPLTALGEPKIKKGKRGRYWQNKGESKASTSSKKKLKSKGNSFKKRKNRKMKNM